MTQPVAPSDHAATTPRGWNRLIVRLWPLLTSVGVSFGIVGLNLVQGILLARLLGPQGRGEYASAILFPQVLCYIGLFGAIEVIARHAANDAMPLPSLRRAALRLAVLTSTITAVMVIVANVIALPADRRYLLPLAVLCSLAMYGQHIVLIVSAVDRGRADFATFNRYRLYSAAALPAMLMIAWLMWEVNVASACLLYTFASTVACIPLLRSTFHRDESAETSTSKDSSSTWKLFREGRPYALSMLATETLERLDTLLFLLLTSIVAQGYFSAMLPVAFPLTVVPNTIGMFLFNAGAKQGSLLSKRSIAQVLVSIFLVQAVLTICFWIVVGPAVRLVYGNEFEAAIVFAIWLAPVAALKGIVQGLESYLKGMGQTMIPVRLRVLSTIATIMAVSGLYPYFGDIGIIQSALIGQIICASALSFVIFSLSPNHPHQSNDSHRV